MSKWNMIIDVAQCHDCNNCFLSCKDEFYENDFPPYSLAQPRHGHRWMDIHRKERGQYPLVDAVYLPTTCMHCDDAPCVSESEGGAVYKRDDGIVLIDPEKARGQKGILDTCPYGAIWWNEEKEVPQKCTFCAHLLDDGWQVPRCVQACPTGAMRFLRLTDSGMHELSQSEGLEVYRPELQTRPRVYYANLYRYIRCFIAGNVALEDIDECADGAQVSVRDGSGQVVGSTVANNYGDFRIDGLEGNSGTYSLEVEYPGYQKQVRHVDLEDSINVGTIFL
jgi:Fe-S-cluster-containing dehydrogenase component